MSLKHTLAKAALAAPFVFAMAANVSAQEKLQVFEPNATDLSKPIAGCVVTTPNQPGLTAWDKLVTVMNARSQMIAASGDKLAVADKNFEMIFTIANNFSGKEGYIITSSNPKATRTNSQEFCFRPTANSVNVDVSKLEKVPQVVNQGELGIALTNNHKLGSKVAVMGMHPQGSLYAVHFNPVTGKAALKEADGQGGRARDVAYLVNFDYSAKMKTVMEQLASAKEDTRVAAATGTVPAPR